MIQAPHKAARPLVRDFGEVENLQVSIKGPGDFVSAADRRAEQILRQELARARPRFGFLLEESGIVKGEDPDHRWIVDPLDGTTNFLHGVPHFSISIGLERRGELVAGVVYDPIKDELFCAEKGAGAYLNDRRLRVSGRSDLASCLIGTGIPVLDWPGRHGFAAQLERISDEVAGVRRLGTASLDLAYVAAGRLDGFWEFGLKPWDVAAGIVLVREAGGMIQRLDGESNLLAGGTLVASNAVIHPRLVQLLRVNQ
jgi:myo-inositol-1(or 4)-monophosphatase